MTTTTAPSPKQTLLLTSPSGPLTLPISPVPPRDALPHEVPIIDISPLLAPTPTPSSLLSLASQIRTAATTNGFFYLSGHGIPSHITCSARRAALDFFHLDESIKGKVHTSLSEHHKYKVGWKPHGSLRINAFESADQRESFSWRYDPAYDPKGGERKIPEEAAGFLKRDGDGFPWGMIRGDVPQFEETVVKCWQAVLELGRKLAGVMALSLGLEETAWDEKMRWPDAALAVNYYRSLGESKDPTEEDVSIGSHTDFQLFTILWQDEVGGLEVLDREGQWLRARPVEGTFVVNFGDYMQRITNDRYKSTVHRVLNRSGKERLSMAFFFGFGLHESCGVLDTCVEDGEKKKYDEISCYEWTQLRLRAMHQTKTGK